MIGNPNNGVGNVPVGRNGHLNRPFIVLSLADLAMNQTIKNGSELEPNSSPNNLNQKRHDSQRLPQNQLLAPRGNLPVNNSCVDEQQGL